LGPKNNSHCYGSWGADIVQGYYFTRPVTSEEATVLLEKDLGYSGKTDTIKWGQ
jgi:predicted signal transduction protein with EAL and GGDEF domain